MHSNAQEIPLTKKSVSSILKNNARGRTHSYGPRELDQIGRKCREKYGDWYANNQDSLYYNSDTLVLVNHVDFHHAYPWWRVHIWEVRKRSSMFQINAQPPSYTITNDWYRYKINENLGKIELSIQLKGEQKEVFEVIKLERLLLHNDPNEPMYVMTLKRVFPFRKNVHVH
jgi:hypothetical protein